MDTRFLMKVLACAAPLCVLVFLGCSEMEEPNGIERKAPAERVIEIDPGQSIVLDGTNVLSKPFNTNTLPSLSCLKIAYDMSHNSGRQNLTNPNGGNSNSIIFGDYTSRGATISVITSFSLATLRQYDVIWLEEDWNNPLSAAEKADLLTYVAGGGSVMIVGDDWGIFTADFGSPLNAFGFGYTPPSASGSTTNIASHPVTNNVTTISYENAQTAISLPTGAMALVKNNAGTGNYIALYRYGLGRVVVACDEFFIDYVVNTNDNRVLGNNLLTYLYTREVTIDIHPGGFPNSINCTAMNGVIPVAILTTPDFDATTVDHTTVNFEGAMETHINNKTSVARRHEEDVDLDGDMDLVLHFRFGDTYLDCNSTTGSLTGLMYCGRPIAGWDYVNMVP